MGEEVQIRSFIEFWAKISISVWHLLYQYNPNLNPNYNVALMKVLPCISLLCCMICKEVKLFSCEVMFLPCVVVDGAYK